FSERLHRNICQAVRRVQADAVSLPAVRGPWGVWPWATLAVAAVLLMALVFAWANPKLSVDGQPNSQATDPAFIAVAQSPGPPLLPGLMGRAALEVDRLIAE